MFDYIINYQRKKRRRRKIFANYIILNYFVSFYQIVPLGDNNYNL